MSIKNKEITKPLTPYKKGESSFQCTDVNNDEKKKWGRYYTTKAAIKLTPKG